MPPKAAVLANSATLLSLWPLSDDFQVSVIEREDESSSTAKSRQKHKKKIGAERNKQLGCVTSMTYITKGTPGSSAHHAIVHVTTNKQRSKHNSVKPYALQVKRLHTTSKFYRDIQTRLDKTCFETLSFDDEAGTELVMCPVQFNTSLHPVVCIDSIVLHCCTQLSFRAFSIRGILKQHPRRTKPMKKKLRMLQVKRGRSNRQ
jgi:hypothetical protein